MKYLTILSYTEGKVYIDTDPNFSNDPDYDYEEYIFKIYGNIDYHYIISDKLEINI